MRCGGGAPKGAFSGRRPAPRERGALRAPAPKRERAIWYQIGSIFPCGELMTPRDVGERWRQWFGVSLFIARRQDFGKVPARFWGDVEGLAAMLRFARNGNIRKIPRDRAPLFRIIRAAKHASAGKGSARFPG